MISYSCHICGDNHLLLFPEYSQLKRITSDCRPWGDGGKLALCETCGTLQKVVDDEFRTTVERIYNTYTMYELAEGGDQQFFDQVSGKSMPRSERILRWMNEREPFAPQGRLLDFGSGNGTLLKAMAELAPGWTLAGSELTEKYKKTIEAIPNCEGLYTCPIKEIPGSFDMITMNNVIEHIMGPVDLMAETRRKLKKDGLMVVETVNLMQSPFDLLQADHCTHFRAATLAGLYQRAGYHVRSVWEDCVPKELTLVADLAQKPPAIETPELTTTIALVNKNLSWLRSLSERARDLAKSVPLGIFGTTIAGTWLFAEMDEQAGFFVDEDAMKAGKSYLGKAVYSPASLPDGSSVILGFPAPVAQKVFNRLHPQYPEINFIMPPDNLP